MPQDLRRKSCDDYDAINPEFPPPSLKLPPSDGRELEKQKKSKKWSLGGFFRRKKKVSDTDSSSPIEDEEEKKGFLERRRARKKRNRGSKDVTGSFEHVIINPANRQNTEGDQGRLADIPSERNVGVSHESLARRKDVSNIRGSSVSLEGVGKKGGRILTKARVEANRGRLKGDSSSDEGGGSSRHSSSSAQRLKSEETSSKDGSLSRRSRSARTERYKKRISRDDESLRDFQIAPGSRISRSDERLSNKRTDKTPAPNRWTAKVVYYESSDYDTKYTAKTKSATPSPVQSPKARPRNTLHYTNSAPAASSYVTFPPSHAREGVSSSHQELRTQHYPHSTSQNIFKPSQRNVDMIPPRLPKSNSDLISKPQFPNSIQKHYPSWGQDVLNRKSASYDCNVNSLHYVNNQISQPHPTDENVLVVQFPIGRPNQKPDSVINNNSMSPPQQVVKQPNPPPPPPRDPSRRLVPSNGISHETSPRPMSYAFEDRNQHRYPGLQEFGSSVSAFQKVPQTHPINLMPSSPMNRHHRSNSDHQIPSHIGSVKDSPPLSRRLSTAQQEIVTRSHPLNSESFPSSPPSDSQQSGVPLHYQYYTDQQPRSRKPIHIAYQNQKPLNDPYLSDSQVIIKPPLQQTPRTRPPGVQNATEFWKQKDQETTKKVHLSEGSPKLIQRHLLNVNTSSERSRSNSPHTAANVVTSKLKLPPLIMPLRGTESSGSLSSQSSPRDVPSPRTPSQRQQMHNEIGIPVFDGSDINSNMKREYRPLSMLEEKQETSEQEISPARERLTTNNPPTPPTRRDSKTNAVTNFENFDILSDNEFKESKRKSSNLDDALNELEAIYNSLKLGEVAYLEKKAKEQAAYESNRLDPSNWNAWVQSRGFESDSSFNYSRSSLESVDSVDSPIRRPSNIRRSVVPDRVTDDMAYRRLNKKDKPLPQEQEVISQAGSFLLVSPTLSPPPFIEPPPLPPVKNEPDITKDDVVYRNIKHVNNTLKVLDPQPPFGIPLGPITPAPSTDYLHVTPKETYRPSFKPRKTPDVVADDLAFRNLRKDSNKEPLFTPEDTTLIDSPTLKKKRAVRSLSANLLSIIQKESMALKNNNNLIYNNNTVQCDLEKSQSFTNVTDALNLNGNHPDNQATLNNFSQNKILGGEDSDVTPRASRHFLLGTTSPLTATSSETLTGSKNSLLAQDLKVNNKVSASSSPRLSLTPERRHTTDTLRMYARNSESPAKHTPIKSESFRINYPLHSSSAMPTQMRRSTTPDSQTVTHQRYGSPPANDQSESDLLVILAREAKEASEQLSRELNELKFENKLKPKNADPLTVGNITEQIDKETPPVKEKTTLQSPHKPSSIGKIVPHKPVKLNTFYITEDNKLENRQTVVTNNPVEIEGSKSMTDLLRELTKSLDFDFGSNRNSEETPSEELERRENSTERTKRLSDETPEVVFKANELRTTDAKECEDAYFSSHEEFPDLTNHPSPASSPIRVQEEQRVQTVTPLQNSFPLHIQTNDSEAPDGVGQKVPPVEPVESIVAEPPPPPQDPRDAGGCSSLADEGKTCLKSCVSQWSRCVGQDS